MRQEKINHTQRIRKERENDTRHHTQHRCRRQWCDIVLLFVPSGSWIEQHRNLCRERREKNSYYDYSCIAAAADDKLLNASVRAWLASRPVKRAANNQHTNSHALRWREIDADSNDSKLWSNVTTMKTKTSLLLKKIWFFYSSRRPVILRRIRLVADEQRKSKVRLKRETDLPDSLEQLVRRKTNNRSRSTSSQYTYFFSRGNEECVYRDIPVFFFFFFSSSCPCAKYI